MDSLSIFAGVDANGVIRFVGDVPRGAACGCFCEACGAPLVARRGDVRRPHFAHEASQERPDCFAGAVNLLRRLAIEVLQDMPQLRLPTMRVRVSTRPPLPVLQETFEHDPGTATAQRWEAKPAQHAPAGLLALASGTHVRVFVEVGGLSRASLDAIEPLQGGLVVQVPLPPDTSHLRDLAAAKHYIAHAGTFQWLRLPDVEAKRAEVLQLLTQSAQAQARVQAEVAALRRMGGWLPPPAPTPPPPPPPPVEFDESPWAQWRKPRRAFMFYGLMDGSAWVLFMHKDGRHVMAPWPILEDGWDESIPARIGQADLELGVYVLADLNQAMGYLSPLSRSVRSASNWTELLAIRWPA
ncbi:hypothetical protein QTI66_31975 [Variovorax sp. J22R133]|uniref:competence protein CoiA family protein n=1 Tax=Variovorax brevis TaxID=3053503 RepID=UPI0025791B03|nr:hypothetical protein [Variovorax sp. J22R133]MDM0116755.1 hypothetical protein [Variovorax sp. J22R133]